jgi:hypothetical protein
MGFKWNSLNAFPHCWVRVSKHWREIPPWWQPKEEPKGSTEEEPKQQVRQPAGGMEEAHVVAAGVRRVTLGVTWRNDVAYWGL